jgi:hypothetical protein
MALLATCHQVYEEASAAFASLLHDLRLERVRFIVDYESMDTFDHHSFSILAHIHRSINREKEGRDYNTIISKAQQTIWNMGLTSGSPAQTALFTLVAQSKRALTRAKSIIVAIDMRRRKHCPHSNGIFSKFLSLVSGRLNRMLGKATRIGFVLRRKYKYWPAGSRLYTLLQRGLQKNAKRLADGIVVHESQRCLTDEAWERDWVAHHV